MTAAEKARPAVAPALVNGPAAERAADRAADRALTARPERADVPVAGERERRDGAGRGGAAGGPAARELPPHELLVRHALEVSRLTVTRMAEELGIPRATLEAYRLGTRRMPAPARARLAAYLEQHAEGLRLIAQALGRAD